MKKPSPTPSSERPSMDLDSTPADLQARLLGNVHRLPVDPMTGKRKGYGFIRSQSGEDYFFHASDLVEAVFGRLTEGDRVQFTPTVSAKGLKAIEVRVESSRTR